jgi:hypothetical protein
VPFDGISPKGWRPDGDRQAELLRAIVAAMPARVLVYCRNSVADVSAEMLVRELRDADLMTLAEALDLPEGEEAAVEQMWKHFRVEPATGSIDGLEIHWHEQQRPIQVRCGPPLDGEIEETLEELPSASEGPGVARVREHLAGAREIVELEMGIDGSLHLAATISEVAAFYLAQLGDGIVCFYHREFASPEDRGATLWRTEE